MLVLSRKAMQKIHLGSEITITVLKVTGSVVRLGIEAPQGVRILRAELKELSAERAAGPASLDALLQGRSPSDALMERESGDNDPAPSDAAVRGDRLLRSPQPPAPAGRETQAARHVAPSADSPRCRVPRAGLRSPGRHPLRGEPASVAVGGFAGKIFAASRLK